MTGAGIALAFVVGACFLVLAARVTVPAGRRARRARVLAHALRLLYLVAGLLLVVRGTIALTAG